MKKVMIVALVCVNIALVLALVFSLNEPAAQAQLKGNADYMVVTGKVNDTLDALYVLDLGTLKLAAFQPDPSARGKLEIYQGKAIKGDFEEKE
jgi:hypothetical protein